MDRKDIQKSISIKGMIISVFIVSILISAGLIGGLIFANWMASAESTMAKMAEDMNSEVYDRINTLMYVPEHINEVNQKLLEKGIVDLTEDAAREKFFVGVLKSYEDEVYSFSYGKETGEYYGARRNGKGVIEIMKNNGDTGGHSWYYSVTEDLTSGELVLKAGRFDPRTRDWYRVAKETGEPAFSPIYKHFVMEDLTVSAAWPIYDNNGILQGVLGTHMLLNKIGSYLEEIVRDNRGYAYIIEKKSGELIANSFGMKNFITLADGTLKRNNIRDGNDHVMQKAYEEYTADGKMKFEYGEESEKLYVNVAEYSKTGLDWVIISAIPGNLLMADVIESVRLSGWLTAMAILLSAAVFYLIMKMLLRPIDNLIGAAERLSSGELSNRVKIIRDDEIGKISISFNKMADNMYQLVNGLETKVRERTREFEQANCALQKTKEDLYLILNSTAEGIYGVDPDGNCSFCNASCLRLLGYGSQEELLGKNMHREIHHSYRDGSPMLVEDCKIMRTFRTGEKASVDDEVFWRSDRSSLDVEYHSYPQYKDGKLVGVVVTFTDISEKKKSEEDIKYLSFHDSLTGLLNRRSFEDAVKKYDTRENLPISIIFADLNGLKLTNDIFGHTAGDMLIKKSSEILKNACRDSDIVARVGGDEFMVLLPHTEADAAKKIIDRVKVELSKEKVSAIKCSMAMGLDTKNSISQDIEEAMRNAENEMYREKSVSRKDIGADTISTIMNTLHEKSPQETEHFEQVSLLCEKIGKALGMHETEIRKLRDAGYLHDIGKIAIDENATAKKGTLSEDEIQHMQQHSIIGYRILNLFEDTMDLADAVFSHHENWDGTGFPKGLKGEEIPVMSRIIALAEMYDRILSEADDENSKAKETALDEIRKNSGKRFDPKITDVFIRVVKGEYR